MWLIFPRMFFEPFFPQKYSSSLPVCPLHKYSPVFLPLTWSHAFCCCCLDYTTAGREWSKSCCSFSHQLLHVSISTWTHSIHFVWWSGARLKFSSLIATCRLTKITLNTVGQFWILIWHSPKYEHGTLNIENWLWILLASKKPYTEISTPCYSSASWLRDRWCTRWCLRPAESCSSWSSAVRLKLSGFRFKEKAEADVHRCAICV